MKLQHLTMSAAVAALLAGSAFAQATDTDTTAPAEPPAMTEGGDMAASPDAMGNEAMDEAPVFASIDEMTVGDVLGMVAYDPNGDRIAEIDYVINPEAGPQAVLGIGGFLGLGEYTVALPLEDFELSEDGTFFVLSTDKEALKAQPEVDESTIESLPDDMAIADLMTETDPAPAATETPAPSEDMSEAPEAADESTMPDESVADTATEETAPAEEDMTEAPEAEDDAMTTDESVADNAEESADENTTVAN